MLVLMFGIVVGGMVASMEIKPRIQEKP